MPYSTDKAAYFTAVVTLWFGITHYSVSPCDCAVVIRDFYNPGGGSVLVSRMVEAVTHGPYCDAILQFCCHKLIGIAVCLSVCLVSEVP